MKDTIPSSKPIILHTGILCIVKLMYNRQLKYGNDDMQKFLIESSLIYLFDTIDFISVFEQGCEIDTISPVIT